jgi:2'-hydroxyisoflavone reductase
MRILVLGGTQMLGRDFVERYMAGHSIVLANRGVTLPGLFPDLEHVVIDRDEASRPMGMGMLGPVDGVVDFSCYSPAHLENTVPWLPKYGRYVFVSTTCVLGLPEGVAHGDVFLNYCFQKRACERWLVASGISHSVVRPCVVVGPHDYTRRFEHRGGRYFWRDSGVEAAAGTIPVGDVSRAIMACLGATEPVQVNLCR